MSLPFLLSKRFFHSQSPDGASAPAVRIGILGIAVGLAVMLITVAVVRGFQREVTSKLTGFSAPLLAVRPAFFASPERAPLPTDSLLLQQMATIEGVERVQTFSEKNGVLKTESDFAAIALKGLGRDYDLDFLRRHIVAGELPDSLFATAQASPPLVISQTTADALQLSVGDRVYAYFFEQSVKMRRFRVAAIYNTHLKQFDRFIALAPLATVQRLNSWGGDSVSGIEIQLSEKVTADEAAVTRIQAAATDLLQNDSLLPDDGKPLVLTLRENPRTASVSNWLTLLDTNVWVILVLLLLVAGFTMTSGLLILILERTATIGLLKALGTTNAQLRRTFLLYAARIIVRGLLIGNALALLLLGLQWKCHLVTLDPDVYYIDTVPLYCSWESWLGLNVATLVLTLLILLLPSHLVSRIQPARAIRFD